MVLCWSVRRGGEAEGAGAQRFLGQPAPSPRCPRRSRSPGGWRGRPSHRPAADGAAPARRRRWCAAAGPAHPGIRGSSPSPISAPRRGRCRGCPPRPPSGRSAPAWSRLAHRGEADAAIAEQDGGDAMPGGRREHRVPGRLAIVMGVDIDPAGGDKLAVGLDVPLGRPGLAADLREPVAIDRDVAGEGSRRCRRRSCRRG